MPRRNPARSGGPRTPGGTAITSGNALTHGAYAAQVVLPGEDPAGFDQLERGLRADFKPRNQVEAALVRDVAVLLWKKWRIEKAAHAVMVAHLTAPPAQEDFRALFGNEKLPEGLPLYAESALALTANDVDDLRALSAELEALQKGGGQLPKIEFLGDVYPQIKRRLETLAQEREMSVADFLARSAVPGFSSALQYQLLSMEIDCNCSLWVVERRDLIRPRLTQFKELKILQLMQDPATGRATDDLNRALYRTLAELRKQQDWRLDAFVQDISPGTSGV